MSGLAGLGWAGWAGLACVLMASRITPGCPAAAPHSAGTFRIFTLFNDEFLVSPQYSPPTLCAASEARSPSRWSLTWTCVLI